MQVLSVPVDGLDHACAATNEAAASVAVFDGWARRAGTRSRLRCASELELIGTSERVQKIQQTGIGIPEKLDLAPGRYEVKFAVRDNPSGLLGIVSVPVELK
jgi:hypothetical protein